MKNKGVEQSERGRTEKNKGVGQSQSEIMKNQVASTSALKPVLAPSPDWLQLPGDVTAMILQKLGPLAIMWTAQKVCKAWYKICRDPSMWRVIDMWRFRPYTDVHGIYGLPDDGGYDYSDDVIAHLAMDFSIALDLSRRQVTVINIEEFGNDFLLGYIAARCDNLRCLRLSYCYSLSFKETAKGFPLLEELHLQYTPADKDDIEAIGKSCPMLKKFALNALACKYGISECNEEAIAVATFMPELHHLQLFRNGMNNEGLEAILNGCRKLESLDLRSCFHLDLDEELEKRCVQQIKVLWLPHDSVEDHEWEPGANWRNASYNDFFGRIEDTFH